MTSLLKILVVVGTRPEAIKLAPLIRLLRSTPSVEVRVCVSAQHRELLDQVFELFDITADDDLDVMRPSQTLSQVASRVLIGLEDVLTHRRPDWVIVQGDTTTTMAASLAAFHCQCRVAHVEAGLRTGDLRSPWPEEFNRRAVAVIAELHFASTASARVNLLREGVHPSQVFVTGNTVIDALRWICDRLDHDTTLEHRISERFSSLSTERRIVLATAHRRENHGEGLREITSALRRLATRPDAQIVFSTHPNPQVRRAVEQFLGNTPHVQLLPPQDYASFVWLMRRSDLIISDSGGVQEEAAWLQKPLLVARDRTERQEGIRFGDAQLVGNDADRIVSAATRQLDDPPRRIRRSVDYYGDGDACGRIVRELIQYSNRRD